MKVIWLALLALSALINDSACSVPSAAELLAGEKLSARSCLELHQLRRSLPVHDGDVNL